MCCPYQQEVKNFFIYSDASKNGLRCVLKQNRKVIAYASRQLKEYKKNITTPHHEPRLLYWLFLYILKSIKPTQKHIMSWVVQLFPLVWSTCVLLPLDVLFFTYSIFFFPLSTTSRYLMRCSTQLA